MALVKCGECGSQISSSAQACPRCGAPRRHIGIVGKLVAGLFIFGVISAVVGRVSQPDQAASATPSAVAAAPAKPLQSEADKNKRFERCRAKLKSAQKLQVLYDMRWDKSHVAPYIAVGPTFFTIPIDAKQGFADTLNCFLVAGDSDQYLTFDLVDSLSGKSVAHYSYGRLEMN